VAGGPALSFDIISSMERDGPLALMLAFLGVVATVLVIFRRGLATPFVIGSLVVGVAWLLGAAMAMGIKINFVNFIAFPITFGIGVDYAVNLMSRYVQERGAVRTAITSTGAAVALCSATTIIGYSELLDHMGDALSERARSQLYRDRRSIRARGAGLRPAHERDACLHRPGCVGALAHRRARPAHRALDLAAQKPPGGARRVFELAQ